jgi:hypothetical protein
VRRIIGLERLHALLEERQLTEDNADTPYADPPIRSAPASFLFAFAFSAGEDDALKHL